MQELSRQVTSKNIPYRKEENMPQRIVINRCYGGFSLSSEAEKRYRELAWIPEDELFWTYDIPRNSPILLQVIDELGEQRASGRFADLRVIEIPDGVKWHIADFDGMEHIAEDHRQWGIPDYEPDDGQLTDDQYDRIREEVQIELFPRIEYASEEEVKESLEKTIQEYEHILKDIKD